MDFHDLEIWKLGMEIARVTYKITNNYPRSEMFGLSSQMRRASVSIPSNIAEGNGRCHLKEYIQFLYISQGSLLELMTQLELSRDLKFVESDDFKTLYDKCVRLNKMLRSLIKKLRQKGKIEV